MPRMTLAYGPWTSCRFARWEAGHRTGRTCESRVVIDVIFGQARDIPEGTPYDSGFASVYNSLSQLSSLVRMTILFSKTPGFPKLFMSFTTFTIYSTLHISQHVSPSHIARQRCQGRTRCTFSLVVFPKTPDDGSNESALWTVYACRWETIL